MALAVRSKQTFTVQTDQTIATIVAGDIVVFLGVLADSDGAHKAIDSAFTVGGVAMTALTQSSGTNNQADIYYLKNAAGGSSVTWANKYHAGSPAFLGAIYVISGADTVTQPSGSGHAESAGAANPSVTLTGLAAGDLILEVIGGNNTPSANASQTVDYTGSGNGSSFAISEKTASAGSNAESWTMTSAAYAFNLIAVLAAATAAVPRYPYVNFVDPGII